MQIDISFLVVENFRRILHFATPWPKIPHFLPVQRLKCGTFGSDVSKNSIRITGEKMVTSEHAFAIPAFSSGEMDNITSAAGNGKENSAESINVGYENGSIDNINKKDCNSERSLFYKKPIKKHNQKLSIDCNETPQEIRRQRILHYQKQNRDACIDNARGVFENVLNSENEEEMEAEEEPEEMEIDQIRKKMYKSRRDYARMFMLSEWMFEVPQDFGDKWIMVPCPVGQRVLLVANKGCTKLFTRRGFQISTFRSAVPGGSPNTCKNNCTILDCIWLREKKICYVLDVLAWANQEMLNCETDFRLYWLKSQFAEIGELKEEIWGFNDHPILPLPSITCDQDFYEFLQNTSTLFPLDGLLFYHKEAHYTAGRTPLVTWLKTYMLSEVLGINVPESYNEKPNNYIDFQHHILTINQTEIERIEKMKRRRKSMKLPDVEQME